MQRRKPLTILIVLAIICCSRQAFAQPVAADAAFDSMPEESFDGPERSFFSAVDSNRTEIDRDDEIGMASFIEPDARRRGRWSVLTELTVLLPSYSTETLATANEHPILGPRVSLGWETEAGCGIRARGWGFESAVDVEQAPAPQSFYSPSIQMVSHQIDFSGSRFDLDFYKRIQHRTGDFAIGASITAAHLTLREKYVATSSQYSSYYGSSYGSPYGFDVWGPDGYDLEDPGQQFQLADIPDIRADFDDIVYLYDPYAPNLENLTSTNTSYANGVYTTTYQGGRVLRNRGAGLGLLMEGNHRFYETPHHVWSVFGRGRIAYLIGRWDEPTSSQLQQGDGNMSIGEAALGLEYRRPFRYADLTIQCSFEVQSWSVSLADRINLAGVTTGVGLSW